MSDDSVTIRVSAPGQMPEVMENVGGCLIVTIDKTDPEHNSALFVHGLAYEAVAEIGAWLISVAKAQIDGKKELPALGQRPEKSDIIMPKKSRSRRKGNIIT